MLEPIEVSAAVVLDRLGVGLEDRLLVVQGPEQADVAEAIAAAGREVTGSVTVLEHAAATRHGEEPPGEIAAAMLDASALVLVTAFSLSHTQARVVATRRGARVASMPDLTRDIFERTMPVDYETMERVGDELAALMTEAGECTITSPGGTDLRLSLRGRDGRNDDGDLRAPGAFGNLPAGEAYIAPFEQEGEGTLVYDGSLATWGLLAEPLILHVEEGRVVGAEDSAAARWLLGTLDSGGPNGRVVAELGVGTNPAARVSGKILEDEKVEGTIHVAFGTSAGIGGVVEASVHIDGLILNASLEIGGRLVMCQGRQLL